jgi:putative ABC transport system permease protein
MFTLWVSLKLAWQTLMQNKVRSVLTLLGMIIGVGAVIAIVSLGEGLRAQFEGDINSLGGDAFFMVPKSPKRPGQAPRQPELFKMTDMAAIERECSLIRSVVPGITYGGIAKYRTNKQNATVLGVYEDYLSVQTSTSDQLDRGRMFTRAEREYADKVVLIGSEITKKLFENGEDPLGKQVRINGTGYTVIGVLKPRPKGFGGGPPNVDDGFLAPSTTVQKRMIGSEDVYWVSLYMQKGAKLEAAKEQVTNLMRQRRRIRNVSDDDFQFISPDDFLKLGNQFINVLVGIFGGIAFISLLVGGVGIMNIMLVSVTERTREIGLRMAVGAGRPAVLSQFMVESIVLTLTGGLIGIGTGYLGSWGVAVLLEQVLHTQWHPFIPPEWVGYSVGVSMMVGVIFGTYPAFKASQLDPVEAMRYE